MGFRHLGLLIGCLSAAGFSRADGGRSAEWEAGPRVVRVVVSVSCFGVAGEGAARVAGRLLGCHVMAGQAGGVVTESVAGEGEAIDVTSADMILVTGDVWARVSGEAVGWEAVLQSRSQEAGEGRWVVLGRSPGEVMAVSHGHVVVAGGGEGELPWMWFDGWRQQQGLGLVPRSMAHRVTREPKAGLAVLRVFFGKADVCVVPATDFRDACAQNPAVAGRMKRLAVSPAFPGAILAVRRGETTARLKQAMESLPSSARGRALASLMGTRGFVPFALKQWAEAAAVVPSVEEMKLTRPAAVADGGASTSRRTPTP